MAVPNLRQTGKAEREPCDVQAKEQARHTVECLPLSFHPAQDLARTNQQAGRCPGIRLCRLALLLEGLARISCWLSRSLILPDRNPLCVSRRAST